jgi:protein AroM
MVRIGFLTIGQSPRPDITRELPESIKGVVQAVEMGALDDLSPKEIWGLYPSAGETLYVSRLVDGRQVALSKERLVPLLQDRIRRLEGVGVQAIVLLCSGEFDVRSNTMLILPYRILKAAIEAVKPRRLGVLIPEEEQIKYAREKWSECTNEIVVANHSPYIDPAQDLYSKSEQFRGCTMVLMDCMGYTEEHRRIVRRQTGLPVLSTRSATFSFLESLYR